MNSPKSYQVIEVEQLEDLLSNPEYYEYRVAVLYWLIKQIMSMHSEDLRHVEVEIIRVTYFGSYPCIGIYYKDQIEPDVGPLVESAIDQLLKEKPVIDLVHSIANSGVSWKELTRNIMDK